MWSKVRKLFTLQTLVGFVIALVLAALVYAGSFVHQQYVNVRQMVALFNTCLAKPECASLFTPPQAPHPPGK